MRETILYEYDQFIFMFISIIKQKKKQNAAHDFVFNIFAKWESDFLSEKKIKAIWDVDKTRFSFYHLHWQFVHDSWESISYMYISEVTIISSAVKSVVAQQ